MSKWPRAAAPNFPGTARVSMIVLPQNERDPDFSRLSTYRRAARETASDRE
ncbi:hypothetical protein [Paraburkholderia tropica]|uniref:hypothetical protein n=1 Tax=Paraburkholderia tropica TaxID=92647 RepID=UPI001590B693|nr:hypothetical protein [Paraburkholderia tropica]QNB11980.1 hypothetical protein G5S35_10635 [Paraburkholderia tropica]